MVLQSNLSWSKYASGISRRVPYRLKSHKSALPTYLRIKLTTTLVTTIFKYCCVVYNDVTVDQNTELQGLQNCAIRFLYNLRRDEHITLYRNKLKWLNVASRKLYFMAITIYKLLLGCVPNYFDEIFIKENTAIGCSSRNTSVVETFHISLYRTSIHANSAHLEGIYIWHSLPGEITNASSLPIFKIKLYKYLLEM